MTHPTHGSSRAALDVAEQTEVLAYALAHNTDALLAARVLIASGRAVRLAAFGSSKHAAGYGAAALHLFSEVPAVVMPAPGEAVTLPAPRGDEPLIVLSQSGRTPALLAAAEATHAAGVPVITVTNEPGSPLEKLATVALRCSAGAERVVAATKSVTAQCLLLRALASDIETESLVAAVREAIALDVTGALGTAPPASVVGGGFAGEWIADEIALKLTEMCGLVVTSESVVEHFHGPRASGASALAFLEADDPNADGLEAIKVGPSDACDVRMPTSGDASLDAIVRLVVGQRIALAWAERLGVDADADRGLSKVTGTR